MRKMDWTIPQKNIVGFSSHYTIVGICRYFLFEYLSNYFLEHEL